MGDLSINIVNDIPSKYILDRNVSATQATLRKDYIEIFPENQHDYSPDGQNEIRFNLASNDGFLMLSETYLKFDFKLNAAPVQGDQLHVNEYNDAIGIGSAPSYYMSEGGMHSCFREVELRSNNVSNLLYRSRHYNREYNLMMALSQSKDHQQRFGAAYADSPSTDPYIFSMEPQTVVGAIAVQYGGLAAHAGRPFTIRISQVSAHPLRVFDVVQVVTLSSFLVVLKTEQIAGDEHNVTVQYISGRSLIADVPILAVNDTVVRVGTCIPNERYVACDGRTHTYTMQLKTAILDPAAMSSLPLILMKGGLHIYLSLEHAVNAIVMKDPYVSQITTDLSYTISNIRFVGRICTPHSQIKREYIDRFNSPEGIVWHIPAYFTQEINAKNAETDNIQAPYGIRSARHVIVGLQPQFIYANKTPVQNNAAYLNDSMATYIKGKIKKFHFRIAAHQYPLREVLCEGNEVSEPFRQLFNIFDRFSSSNNRLQMCDMRPYCSIIDDVTGEEKNDVQIDAKWFLMAADLARDNGEYQQLCGADVSLTPLQMMIERSDLMDYGDSSFTYFVFLWYDQYWRLSAGTQTVMS